MNTETTDSQDYSQITVLNDDSFVITWHSNDKQGTDDSNFAIKAQIFDVSGGKIGDEFLVNSVTFFTQARPDVTAFDNGGFAITWNSRELYYTHPTNPDIKEYSREIKAKIFDLEDNQGYEAGETYSFNLSAKAYTGDSIGDITISNVPDELTFSAGTNNNNGTWTITQAEIADLQITLANGYNGGVTLGLTLTSTTVAGESVSTSISVPILVGALITGTTNADTKSATSASDNVKLGTAIDILNITGAPDEFTISVEGDYLKIVNIAAGDANTDFLHSVETLKFSGIPVFTDVADLVTNDLLHNMESDEFDHWLTHNYNYDIV